LGPKKHTKIRTLAPSNQNPTRDEPPKYGSSCKSVHRTCGLNT
jgi:hypothetical protein